MIFSVLPSELDLTMILILWRFTAKSDSVDTFAQMYDSSGPWVDIFRRYHGYLGTELHRSVDDVRVFMTIDRWEDRWSYETFLANHDPEYTALDKRCQELTESEDFVGLYENVTAVPGE
ncbi:MAG: hypothetical protein A3G43_11055 [Ignavibacteria bacterium RIFCSPLOWO2_12_FULL_56_21]|nr:MAG: hypothetical protein A2X68_01525 [Ignavibacteria bacterium GWC2_56_12]OGU68233.1 MAG: hypothetical protein A3C56_02210 [Ignavibacteria bacterium RIFCSPHIGHO2_02_FULL_56_12]OGU76279.1 MAG: hypothetical protein A3G43_11055 [Ignavibacteria bacterium RIFCSPLOWO2_12_FULL_56_21]